MKKTKGEKFISFVVFLVIAFGVFNYQSMADYLMGFLGRGQYTMTRVKTVPLENKLENSVIPSVHPLEQEIVVLEKTRLTLYNRDGEAVWQVVNDFSEVLVAGNENFFVVGDQVTGEVYAYDYRSNINARVETAGEVKGIEITRKGYVLLQVGENEIQVYDPRLNLISSLKINQGVITHVAFNESDEQVYLVDLDMASGRVKSTLYKYRVTGELVGSIEMDNEVIFELFFEGKALIKLSDLETGIIGEDMLLETRIPSTGLVDRAAYGAGHLVVQNYDRDSDNMGGSNIYDLLVYDIAQKKVSFKRSYPEAFAGITFLEEKILGHTNSRALLYDLEGVLLGEFNFSREFKNLKVLGNDRIFIQGVDYFEIYTLEKR
ncbi:MAG: hypothetical protein AVO33_03215 [delta proteobacterium ML8_F1]|nr:MAG: hypothetical protein AVO33_03215 [delta proteobacterium ML8_F1]